MPAWAETFAALRRDFVAASPARLAALSSAIDAVERRPGEAAALGELARQFHGFAGAGSTYGFPGVSELGRDGEESVTALRRGGGPAGPERIARWRGLGDGIARELAVREDVPR